LIDRALVIQTGQTLVQHYVEELLQAEGAAYLGASEGAGAV